MYVCVCVCTSIKYDEICVISKLFDDVCIRMSGEVRQETTMNFIRINDNNYLGQDYQIINNNVE